MTSKLNLFFFFIFLAVLGLNYYISKDSSESREFINNPNEGLAKSMYGFVNLNPRYLTTSLRTKNFKTEIFDKLKTDTLTHASLFK